MCVCVCVDYIPSTGSAYQRTNLFAHHCLQLCLHVLGVCVCVCVWPDSGSCLQLKLETRYSPKVQLLIWSQQLFSPTFLLPPPPPLPPPSIFLMLFQLQTFRKRGILSQHILSAHTYIPFSSASRLLMPFPPSFHSAENSLKFKFALLARQEEKPVLLKQSTSVTDQYLYFFLTLSPSQLPRLFSFFFGST